MDSAGRTDVVDMPVPVMIRGALRAWDVLDQSAFLYVGDQANALEIHDDSGRVVASVRRGKSPLGQVWYVALDGRRERVFPSVVTALRYLRGRICPERESGRVLFGQGES